MLIAKAARRAVPILVLLLVAATLLVRPRPARGLGPFNVNTTDDTPDATVLDGLCMDAIGNCSLRAAIMQADQSGEHVTVNLPTGEYDLTIQGSTSDASTGDLDVTATNGPTNITIAGAGAATTTINSQFPQYGADSRAFNVKSGRLYLSGVTITGGLSDGNGGAILVGGNGSLSVSNSVLTRNFVAYYGGAIAVIGGSASALISDSTISHNAAGGFISGDGGALYDEGSLTVVRSTITANEALDGGGIYIAPPAPFVVFLVNSTVSENGAYHSGGGLYAGAATDVSLFSDTVTANQANFNDDEGHTSDYIGGGVYAESGSSFDYEDTILADNTETAVFSPPFGFTRVTGECAGSIYSSGYNLLDNWDTSHCTVFKGLSDQQGKNPDLDALADNGGPTQTHALESNSPAIDAGNPLGCPDGQGGTLATDQRGYSRSPQGDNCDIGAYEFAGVAPATPTPTPAPTPSPSPSPSPAATGTPTVTPTNTPTATPTATVATGTPHALLLEGDTDCNQHVQAVDALDELDFLAGLSFSHANDCPAPDDTVGSQQFGDVDCNQSLSTMDAVRLLKYAASLPLAHAPPCPDVGQPLP